MLIPYGVTGVTGVTGMTGFTGNATIAECHEAAKMDATCHIRLTFQQQGIVFTESDIESAGVDYDLILNGDNDLVFGKAVMAEFKTCMFMSGQTAQLVWENEFLFEIGMDIDEERTVWTKIGLFTGTRPDKVNSMGLIDFVACDRMQKFDILADQWIDGLSYPMTLRQMYDSLCRYVGVYNEIGDELVDIMNKTYTNAPIIAHGMLCRDILALMAEAAGCYARITPEGKVKMVWFKDHTDYQLDERDEFSCQSLGIHFANTSTTWEDLEDSSWEDLEDTTWSDLEYYEQQLKIVAVSSRQTEDDIGFTYPSNHSDGNVYLIVDNPYLLISNNADAADILGPIYNRLRAFGGYLPMSVDCIGNPLIEPGDMITVSIHDDFVRMPIFYKSMNVTMGCADRYEITGNVKRAEVPESVREELRNGGKRHIFRNDIDQLYSEIFDDNHGSRIEQNANGITQLAEKKARIRYNASAPTGTTGDPLEVGDYWLKTTTNEMYRFNGSRWYQVNYSDPNKYTVQSGIDIKPEGVEISGGKYVKILAGATGTADGAFDVDAQNFKINSVEKKVQIGNWEFNRYGFESDSSWEAYGNTYHEHFRICDLNISHQRPEHSEAIFAYDFSHYRADEQYPDVVTRDVACFDLISHDGIRGLYHQLRLEFNWTAELGNYAYWWPVNDDLKVYYKGTVIAQSSREVKENIQELNNVGIVIDQLAPVSFSYKADPVKSKKFGLIYEDTIDILPEICISTNGIDANTKAIDYTGLIPILLKEVQELRKRVATLEEKVNELERE